MTTDKKDKKDKIYYGIYPVPKGQKRANMEQAVTAHQLRYYGLKKVDPQLAISEVQESKIAPLEKKSKELLRNAITAGQHAADTRKSEAYRKAEIARGKLIIAERNDIEKQIATLKAAGHGTRKAYLQDPRYEVKNGEIVNKPKPKKIKKVPVKKAPVKKAKAPVKKPPPKRKMADIPRK